MLQYTFYIILFNLIIGFTDFEHQLTIVDKKYLNVDNMIITDDINSNAIYEMINDYVDNQDTIWIRTGSGLSFIYFSDSNSPSFKSISHTNLPEGGSPSFIINNDIMAISGAKSIYQNNRYRPMGTGISWSIDLGGNWQYIDQPIDDVDTSYVLTNWGDQDSIRFKAITTQIYNVTYDIQEYNGYIYATSFAGGLRRFNYTIDNPQWELVPLPMDSQSNLFCNQIDIIDYEYDPVDPPIGNDNHKAFSIFIKDNHIWVGTGDGINKGLINPDTNCIDWIHYNENNGMGDRWVIGIQNQTIENLDRLWAISWDPSLNRAIPHNLSYTDDNGLTWNFISFFKDIGAIVYDLNFDEEDVYASTDLGLYRTYNGNINLWFKYHIEDSNNQTIMSDKIYSSNINFINNQSILWAGSPDGLFYSYDEGFSWDMYRAWNRTIDSSNDNQRVSAYPNPFYVDEGYGKVRIVYYNGSSNDGYLDIFDFSMQHIVTINEFEKIGDEAQFIWSGKDKFSKDVSNGVYFCRLTLDGKIYWTKLMVVHS